MVGKNKIPDRWLDYSNIGKIVPQTKFIAFKVPLKEQTCKNRGLDENKWFTTTNLLQEVPNIKLVVNLTNTYDGRYYFYEDFKRSDIKVLTLPCEGRGKLPSSKIMHSFYHAVDDFMSGAASTTEDSLIGVHCTHGLNRTGYFICKYMVERLGMAANTAIELFEDARGHKIERLPYIDDIRCSKFIENFTKPLLHPNMRDSHRRNRLNRSSNKERQASTAINSRISKEHSESVPRKNWREEKRKKDFAQNVAEGSNKRERQVATTEYSRSTKEPGKSRSRDNSWREATRNSRHNFSSTGTKEEHPQSLVTGYPNIPRQVKPREDYNFTTSQQKHDFFSTFSRNARTKEQQASNVSNSSNIPSGSGTYQNFNTTYYSPLDNMYEESDRTKTSRYQKKQPRR